MKEVLYIISFYFLIGGIALLKIKKKHPEITRANTIKYFSYLFIVSVVIAAIHLEVFPYFSIIILYVALYEVIKSNWRKIKTNSISFVIPALIYIVIAWLFFRFSVSSTKNEQLFIYVIVLVFDGFSQITGQLWGKHKLIKVSPGKTIEGTIGGLIISLLTVLLIRDSLTLKNSFAVALLIIVSSLAGDLLASWNKRINGIKDYGTLLPGHGGVLDRFDSLLLAGAFYNALLQH